MTTTLNEIEIPAESFSLRGTAHDLNRVMEACHRKLDQIENNRLPVDGRVYGVTVEAREPE